MRGATLASNTHRPFFTKPRPGGIGLVVIKRPKPTPRDRLLRKPLVQRLALAQTAPEAATFRLGVRLQVFHEINRALPPGMLFGVGARGRAVDLEAIETGLAQIIIDEATAGSGNDVLGAMGRKGRDRCTATHRLQIDQTECVGPAGEDKNIGIGEPARQFGTEFRTREDRVRIALLQFLTLRAVTHHHLGAGQVELEKGLDILLDRDPADIDICLLYTSPSPRDLSTSRMPSSA